MAKKKKYRKKARASGATAFVTKVGLLCCFLLLINAAICQVIVVVLRGMFPVTFDDPRVIQGCMFFGPILLILVEFWIYDRRIDAYSRRQTDDDGLGILEQESRNS